MPFIRMQGGGGANAGGAIPPADYSGNTQQNSAGSANGAAPGANMPASTAGGGQNSGSSSDTPANTPATITPPTTTTQTTTSSVSSDPVTPEAPSATSLASSTTSSATALPQPTAPTQAPPVTLNVPSVVSPIFVAVQPSSSNDGAAANAGSLSSATAIKVGSADAPADFLGSGFSGYQPAIGATGVALRLTPTDSAAARDVLNMNFVGASASATSSESGTASLSYSGVWAGIGVTYSSSSDKLDFSFDIAPGGNPALAQMQFPNDQLSVNSRGDLVIALPDGRTVTEQIPLIFQQTIDGTTQKVTGFDVTGDVASIAVQNYDHHEALIIDPVLDAGPQVSTVTVNGSFATMNIVSATGNGTTATITTDGTAHGFWVGELVTLTGVTPGGAGGLAGTVTVTGVPSATTFQFASTYNGSETLSGATVTASLAGAQASMVDSIVYGFTEPVNLTAAAFSISVVVDNTSTGDEVGVAPTLNAAPVPFTNEWVVTFTDPVNNSVIGKSIANGAYSVTINPLLVKSVSDEQYLVHGRRHRLAT